jgi:N-acetylneuraminic acid mutarotase
VSKTFKLLIVAVSCMAVVLLTACGGGGSGSVTTYDVVATAVNNGSIYPPNTTVNAGGTITFTVTPNSGYVISGVTGCGGSLSGNTYTTGTINANCAVTASFSAAFTWVDGSSSPDANGVYGTQGIAVPSNVPGARHGPVTWTGGADGTLWMFGGYGVGSLIFNDLWEYSTISGKWTWVGGSNTAGASGVYGTQGFAAATNIPGALGAALSWPDDNGNLWLFGGYGYDSMGARGWLNALWKYSPTSAMWTWYGGSTTTNASGVYGTQGVAAATNVPGARAAGGWTDFSGNVWLFGGYGYDSTGALGRLNDLWEYSPSSGGEWTWVGGSTTVNAKGVYGTQGIAATANVPGARSGQVYSRDVDGNLWLFGGYGYDSTGIAGYLNDMWKYSPMNGMWTWVAGSNIVNTKGAVYGTQGVAAAMNVPGPRVNSTAWLDASGNLWLFGGSGYDSTGTLGELNDLWKYSPASGEATWVGGSNTANAGGIYGTQGVAASANVPGARDGLALWGDGFGNVWLFGGEGYNPTGADPNAPAWNDLWELPVH